MFSSGLGAQNNVYTRVDPHNSEIIDIKWFGKELINEEGYNVYRKSEGAENWKLLNKSPIRPFAQDITNEDVERDPQLKNYCELAKNSKGSKSIALLAVLLKSFKSDEFAAYLGLRWNDTLNDKPINFFTYKVMRLDKGQESLVGESSIDGRTDYKPIAAPEGITFKTGKNEIQFVWKPETSRYYGVEIYRNDSAAGRFKKITNDPVIISKGKQQDGNNNYGPSFFIDRNLKASTTYEYYFTAVDFFGSYSAPSKIMKVYLKDKMPPSKVDSIYHLVTGRSVKLWWLKKNKEADIMGYNIYRTNNNDTDYVKVNQQPIDKESNTFVDAVNNFSSYMYMVGVIDKDSNETISNPYLVEVQDAEPPQKPTGLILKPDSGKIKLAWKKNPEQDILGYHIYRTINEDKIDAYVKLTPLPVKETTFEDQLPANAKNNFLYRVIAVDETLNRSPYSDPAKAAMPDKFPPSSPFLQSTEILENGNVLLQWFSNTEQDLAGYHVYRKDCKLTKIEKLNHNIIAPGMTRYTDRHAEAGIEYIYFLLAQDSTNNLSATSNSCIVKVKPKLNSELRIADFTATYNQKRNTVNLGWKILAGDSLRGVIVYKKEKSDVLFSPLTALTGEDNITDKEVAMESEYQYEIRAYDNRGNIYRSPKILISTAKK